MAFLSQARHTSFSNSLAIVIDSMQEQIHDEQAAGQAIDDLKEKLALLENIYTECDQMTRQLRTMIRQYYQVQNTTRVKLRVCRSKFIKP